MTVTIEEGDGTMQRRLDMGLCPKCQTAVDPGPATVCRCCGLQIGGVPRAERSQEVNVEDIISNDEELGH